MVKLVWNEEYWRRRAEEARTIEDPSNFECKRIKRKIAQSYDRLAEHLTLSAKTSRNATMAHHLQSLPHNTCQYSRQYF
jgi:hypothetical protein